MTIYTAYKFTWFASQHITLITKIFDASYFETSFLMNNYIIKYQKPACFLYIVVCNVVPLTRSIIRNRYTFNVNVNIDVYKKLKQT